MDKGHTKAQHSCNQLVIPCLGAKHGIGQAVIGYDFCSVNPYAGGTWQAAGSEGLGYRLALRQASLKVHGTFSVTYSKRLQGLEKTQLSHGGMLGCVSPLPGEFSRAPVLSATRKKHPSCTWP